MKMEYAEQYNCVCVVVEIGDTADEVMNAARENEAIYYEDGPEDECFCVRLPNRPQEIYTERSLKGSIK